MKILITGCAGLIGTNAVEHYASEHQVIGLDNLSRQGSESNLIYLRQNCPFVFYQADIVNFDFDTLPEVDVIIHLAAQVGVGSSIEDPTNDLKQNIIGTFRVLEYARRHKNKPVFIYPSTNKVYGDLQVNSPVDEATPLSFCTPYGVSKGSAEQYVLDYNRIYDVPTVVFRQSCIYGEHQLGSEGQGWLAWFFIANQTQQPLTIFGDGEQRRDILHVSDLLLAYDSAIKNIDKVKGQAFNMGGGDKNTLSLNELVKKAHITTPITYSDWRPSDQKYYVSDISKAKKLLGWSPKVGVDEGLKRMQEWVEGKWPR